MWIFWLVKLYKIALREAWIKQMIFRITWMRYLGKKVIISCQNVCKYQIRAEPVSSGVHMQYKAVACSFFCNSVNSGKENCVGYYMERTKKYKIWFQAASEFKREENNYEQGHFLCKAIGNNS